MPEFLVSIIMPVRNGERFLTECLKSVCRQTLTDWELLAVDDHSTDQTPVILEAFAENDKRIRLLKNPGKGIPAALEAGFLASSGRHLSRMDADDIMAPEKMEKLFEVSESSGNGVAVSLVKYFSESALGEGYRKYASWLNELTLSGTNYRGIYRECVIPSPAWMMPRKCAEERKLLTGLGHPEDYDFSFRLYRAGIPVLPVAEVLHYWRDHAGRTSRNDPAYDIRRFGPFKLKWWLELEYTKENTLVLWGSGKKGKELAGELLLRKITFTWISENPRKSGMTIYGVVIKEPRIKDYQKLHKIIIAVSAPSEWSGIQRRLESAGLIHGRDFFLFY